MPRIAPIEKFVTDLAAAVDPAGAGGQTITSVESLRLTDYLTTIVLSTGITPEQIQTITDDIAAVLVSLGGISTAQLKADLQQLATDVRSCAASR